MSQRDTPGLHKGLTDDALDVPFAPPLEQGWLDKPVAKETLHEIYDFMKSDNKAQMRGPLDFSR